ncbi:unnamed protein product [Rotaria sp. Silwood1]|nr:unnamed protein product [Rotaria sp. Silwood1]CAF1671136.1 unnamed protein product [Rotaria sp. Silwood1]
MEKNPRNDGDSRITSYIIEKRSPGSRDWTEVTELPARDHSYTILNLKEDDEVSFHVQPLNVVHPSELSRPTDVVIIEDHMGTHSSSFIIDLQIEV